MRIKKFYAVIIDVMESSKVKDRNRLTEQMERAILKINKKYHKDCYAPFEITRGDEIAAVLKSIENSYDIVSQINEIISPEKIRTVIVYDDLNAGLKSFRSSVIDGPAFYRGNSLMAELKKTQKTFLLKTGIESDDRIIESLINLLLWQWDNFTDKQKRIIRLYQKIRNQKKVAEKILRTQQQVQSTLETCRWELIDNAESTLKEMFKRIDKNLKVLN